jgi:hypothetical protein
VAINVPDMRAGRLGGEPKTGEHRRSMRVEWAVQSAA